MNVLWIYYILACFTCRHTNEEDFVSLVEELLQDLENRFNMPVTMNTARKKMTDKAFENRNENQVHAGLIVNVYTSADEIYNAPRSTFHDSLNSQLIDNPAEIWKRTEHLLNNALDILGLQKFKILFHGEDNRCDCSDKLDFTKMFISTTVDPHVTRHFRGKSCKIHIIHNAMGTYIEALSVDPSEKEVLLKTGTLLKEIDRIGNKEDIAAKMKEINKEFDHFPAEEYQPKCVVILEQTHNDMNDLHGEL